MTVTVQNPFNTYTASPGATLFPYQFKIAKAEDLLVTVDGVPFALGINYSVTGAGDDDGGDATLLVPLSGGERVLLMRNMQLERSTDYQQNGEFPADIVNLDFDSIWLALQQYQADSNRTLKFPIEEQGGQTLNVTAAARAGKALIFDVNGSPTVSDDNYVDQAANAAASAAAALASQQAAAGSQAAAENASGTATVAASQALYYAQHGTGFTAGTAYDLGSVADPLNIFNTDLGSVP